MRPFLGKTTVKGRGDEVLELAGPAVELADVSHYRCHRRRRMACGNSNDTQVVWRYRTVSGRHATSSFSAVWRVPASSEMRRVVFAR